MRSPVATRQEQALRVQRSISLLVLVSVAVTCDSAPTGNDVGAKPPVAFAPRATLAQVEDSAAHPQGTIPLPVNQTFSNATVNFGITQSGNGAAGAFKITSATNNKVALLGSTAGTGAAVRGLSTGQSAFGPAGLFEVNTSSSAPSVALIARMNGTSYLSTVLSAVHSGEGGAAYLETNSENIGANALEVNSRGDGAAGVFTVHPGTGSNPRGAIEATSDGAGSAGLFRHLGSGRGDAAIDVATTGNLNPVALFTMNSGGFGQDRGAIEVMTDAGSTGWAGMFTSTGAAGGVQITTNGGPGLQVTGGTKNAVVGTSSGARALYTEESSEVWFTDYGFARLTNGRVHIAIDSTFAETVNLGEPYHVFVQTYGDAELVVRNRTAEGFDVIVREGDERDAEFSYRLVAKRLGFETERMKRAPWADSSTLGVALRIRLGKALASTPSGSR